jgi:hypothetical protein
MTKYKHFISYQGFKIQKVAIRTLVEQSLMTLPKHSSSPSVFIEVHVAQRLFFCVKLCKSLLVFFVLAIILSVLLRSERHFYLETWHTPQHGSKNVLNHKTLQPIQWGQQLLIFIEWSLYFAVFDGTFSLC